MPVARVDADRDLARPLLAGGLHQARLLDRDGAQDHALRRRRSIHCAMLSMVRMPPPSWAGTLTAFRMLCDRGAVDRMALDRAVEVDQVQPFAAGIGEGLGLGRRAVVEHRGACHVAAQQAHALAVLEVDGGEQKHGGADLARRAARRHSPRRGAAESYPPRSWPYSAARRPAGRRPLHAASSAPGRAGPSRPARRPSRSFFEGVTDGDLRDVSIIVAAGLACYPQTSSVNSARDAEAGAERSRPFAHIFREELTRAGYRNMASPAMPAHRPLAADFRVVASADPDDDERLLRAFSGNLGDGNGQANSACNGRSSCAGRARPLFTTTQSGYARLDVHEYSRPIASCGAMLCAGAVRGLLARRRLSSFVGSPPAGARR